MRLRVFTCLAGVLIACLGLTAAQDLKPPDQEFVLEFESELRPDGEVRLSGYLGGFLPDSTALDLKNDFTLEGWVLIKEIVPGEVASFFGKHDDTLGDENTGGWTWVTVESQETGSVLLAKLKIPARKFFAGESSSRRRSLPDE